MNATVYVLGIILQAVAAVIALLQVRHAPHRLPWLLIAFSSLLIVARRAATLEHSMKAGMELAMAEVLTLLISLLFFLGVVLMSRMFKDVAKKNNEIIESEEKYRTLHHSMMDAFVSVDMEGRIIDYNDSYLNMLGYTPEEISKLTYKDISPEKWHILEAAIIEKQVLPNGYSEIYEKEYRRKDGTVFPVELRTMLLRDAEGAATSMWAIARDITERRQAGVALIESEKRFSSAFEFAAIGMAIVSPQGTFLKVNKALCNYLGYTTAELTALTFQDITHPDDLEKDLAYVHQMLAGEINTYQMEKRYFDKQGNLVWVLLSVSLVHDEQHKPQYFISQIQDITARKMVEEALKRNQKLLAETEMVGKVGGWEFNIDTGIQTWTEEIYNIQEVDLTYNPTVENGIKFYTQNSIPIIEQAVKQTIENNEPFDLDLEIITAKGNLRYVHVIGKPDLDHHRVYGFFQDITTRRLAEAKSISDHQLLQMVINHSQYLVYAKDLDGKFILASQSLAEFFNQQVPEQLLGKTSHDFLPKEIADQHRTNDLEVIARQFLISCEETANTKDGLHTFLTNKFPLFDDNGKTYAVCGTSVDITDRKQAEAEKAALEAQNRQLQKTDSLTRMAGAIAHHFNNQLGVVIGYLEMVIEELPKGSAHINSLTKAMQSAWKAADMSGLMLTYLGQTHDKRESLDLSYSCHKILPLIKSTLPGSVVMETDFPLPRPIIMANAGEMQKIITNLITNSWEAIGNKKGTISLSVKTVSPIDIPTKNRFPMDWESLDKTLACLEVTDTGCGIEDKDIEKLFDPFFSTKFTGRGMGLAVVLGLANSHKGVITVESKPGNGSTFRLFFPASEEALAQPQTEENETDVTISKPSPGKMAEGGTVLVVEDEEILRDMATAMLKSFGFIVLKAKDGIEALEVFGKHQGEIKFVLTDQTMPRMNGWETLTAMRKLKPCIPVILASGYDKAHVMEGDHPELPQAFLAKPYNLKALRAAISQALSNK